MDRIQIKNTLMNQVLLMKWACRCLNEANKLGIDIDLIIKEMPSKIAKEDEYISEERCRLLHETFGEDYEKMIISIEEDRAAL